MSDTTLTEWARLLFGTLAKCGVRDVVVSPGSRSTPFAWAALHTEGLRCHSLWDERSAGFFALGQVRATGRPSVLLCTSGSAAAEYFPAVVEAAQANLPLVIVTADRPLEVMDASAAQTMNQLELYGRFARRYVELGHPERASAALDGLVRRVAQAVDESRGPRPGPVHINARARKPLEPVAPRSDDDKALSLAVSARLERGPTSRLPTVSSTPSDAALQQLADRIQAASSGLIVCGPLAMTEGVSSHIFSLAHATGFPLCPEMTSQARGKPGYQQADEVTVLGAFDALLASRFGQTLKPDCVLVLGTPPTSSAFERFRASTEAEVIVVGQGEWADPSNRARFLIDAEPSRFAAVLARALGSSGDAERMAARRSFAQRCARAENSYWRIVDQVLAESPKDELGEGAAVRAAIDAAPQGCLLGLGNSLPIRDVDAFVPPNPGKATRVWCQRGVNGIDGLVSGAAGAAHGARLPSLTILGDVSFLHDVGGLAAMRGLELPAVLVVIDNGGGRIFDELPVQSAVADSPELARFWLTPPNVDLQHAAALFRVGYQRASQVSTLNAALKVAFEQKGCTLVHAVVAPHSARTSRARIRALFEESLERELI
ncbi:MAG TPA: 2-succinyl-5-enolpyruvyl-6-hydroxy-3-cyclohexene-1-carboxylic-acid synthase [Polyangiaceae bacterium]|nr:2-succinyl-5-enolpyruvyl-6-hydroxy-3-cyclohexene-1-carboxylic-acid synthase [Polyangiaceae bacterium]